VGHNNGNKVLANSNPGPKMYNIQHLCCQDPTHTLTCGLDMAGEIAGLFMAITIHS